jgi:hypothetical protein
MIAYRGWIGGIVSIDDSQTSRLADPKEAVYYLTTLILQVMPYMLSGGIGVNLGLALFRPKPYYQGKKWLGIPIEAVRDVLWIYLLVIPLFLIHRLRIWYGKFRPAPLSDGFAAGMVQGGGDGIIEGTLIKR